MSDVDPIQPTLADRALAAAASLLFSLPAVLLLWWLADVALALYTPFALSAAWLAAAVIALAALAFAFPRRAPAMVGRLWGFFAWLGKLW